MVIIQYSSNNRTVAKQIGHHLYFSLLHMEGHTKWWKREIYVLYVELLVLASTTRSRFA